MLTAAERERIYRTAVEQLPDIVREIQQVDTVELREQYRSGRIQPMTDWLANGSWDEYGDVFHARHK